MSRLSILFHFQLPFHHHFHIDISFLLLQPCYNFSELCIILIDILLLLCHQFTLIWVLLHSLCVNLMTTNSTHNLHFPYPITLFIIVFFTPNPHLSTFPTSIWSIFGHDRTPPQFSLHLNILLKHLFSQGTNFYQQH